MNTWTKDWKWKSQVAVGAAIAQPSSANKTESFSLIGAPDAIQYLSHQLCTTDLLASTHWQYSTEI